MTTATAGKSRFGAAFEWLGVERAWTRTRGRPDVVIGIVAHGVQLDHPLIGANIQSLRGQPPLEGGSHEIPGTHAAGVAAGRQSGVESFSGVAPEARILPVRYSAGSGQQALDLPHAIEYAAEMGASIINLGRTAELDAPTVQRAIQYAASRNALVVCSAPVALPNAPPKTGDPVPNLLAVVAVSESGGLVDPHSGSAHLAAPGFGQVPHWRGKGHTPHMDPALGAAYVSGCAALVKSLNPTWGYHEIKEHLLASATDATDLSELKAARVLNVANAVLGPIELAANSNAFHWSALSDAVLQWKLRYRTPLCVNVAALYRPHGDEHWRELGTARAGVLKMTVPGSALRRSAGVLRLACRESNFHSDEVALIIR